MFELQNHKCAICNEEEKRRSRTDGKICVLAIDHCHKTGKIRELLCHSCNVGLGSFRDDVKLLETAIVYLKEHE